MSCTLRQEARANVLRDVIADLERRATTHKVGSLMEGACRAIKRHLEKLLPSDQPATRPPCDEDCRMCSGEFCLACGGKTTPCDHDTADRHEVCV